MRATVNLRDLVIETQIGTYGPEDVVPRAHILDMVLTIDPALVFIDRDGMDRVFDYDPLLRDIDVLARDEHYHTQERLMTRIVHAAARYSEITEISVSLCKTPVLDNRGYLGVTLVVDAEDLAVLRQQKVAA
ncbi:MAG: dihydroneopterin aldolase [Pelagibaca sp.]